MEEGKLKRRGEGGEEGEEGGGEREKESEIFF